MVMVSFGPTGYKVVRLPVVAAVRESSALDLQIFQFGQHHSDEETENVLIPDQIRISKPLDKLDPIQGIQTSHQDADRAAFSGDRCIAVLGVVGVRPDYHAQGRWLANPCPCAYTPMH